MSLGSVDQGEASRDERRRSLRRNVVLVIATIIVVAEGYIAVFTRENDFVVHREYGIDFLHGTPYQRGGDWYPLPRVMLNALIAVAPVRATRAVCFALCIVATLWILRRWHELDERRASLDRKKWFAASAIAAAVMLPYLLRDLDECGLQLFLLFFLTAGGWALQRGRAGQAGFWLATAAAYKATPILCLPYLLWKRRWQPAAMMVVWLGVWAVVPAAFIGWDKTVAAHEQYLARGRSVTSDRAAYPSIPGGIELPKQQNQSLLAVIARYAETHPAGHPLVLDHPWFKQFGTLDRETAFRLVRGIVLLIGVALAWRFRRSANGGAGAADLPAEWAVVCLFCALMSPLCWKQHLVLGLPAMLLLSRSALAEDRHARLHGLALGCFAAVAVLIRHGVVGRELSVVFMSYKLDAIVMLTAVGLTLALDRTTATSTQSTASTRATPAVRHAA